MRVARGWWRTVVAAVATLTLVGWTAAAPTAVRPQPPDAAHVRRLIETGRYAEAEIEAADLHALDASADTGDLLVKALILNGRGAEPRTRELADAAVRVRRAANPVPAAALAASLANLGEVVLQAGDYSAAVRIFREALQLVAASAPAARAVILDDLAQALTELVATDAAAFDQASQFVDQALEIWKGTGSTTGVARALHTRGLLRQRKGDYDNARPDLE